MMLKSAWIVWYWLINNALFLFLASKFSFAHTKGIKFANDMKSA